LQELSFGEAYNAGLQAISDRVVTANVQPGRPNGSAIKQVRTNEFLNGPWELREFVLATDSTIDGTTTHPLVLTTVKQTPDQGLNDSIDLTDFINNNRDDLIHVDPFSGLVSPLHRVPDNLLGARSPSNFQTWQGSPAGTINDNNARHQFALMTCNGCHTQETGTGFTHVKPRQSLVEAALSTFLTGGTVADPVSRAVRQFNDLERREDDLLRLLHSTRFEAVGLAGLRSRVH